MPDDEPRAGIHARFESTAGRLARGARGLGVDARVGEVAGEYCPGRYSVNARGAVKLAGIGQRLVGGGSHTGVVLVVEGEERVNEAIGPVYAALGLDWGPRSPARWPARTATPGWDAPCGTRCRPSTRATHEIVEAERRTRRRWRWPGGWRPSTARRAQSGRLGGRDRAPRSP